MKTINHSPISIFKNIKNSKTPFATSSIEEVLSAIKVGVMNINGKTVDLVSLKERAVKAVELGKKSVTYKAIKESVPCVTWATNFESDRKIVTNLDGFSNALYFDIDEFEGSIEDVKSNVFSLAPVKAVWTSLSGKGLGGIIYSNSNTVEAFNAFTMLVADLGYKMDIAVKDVTSRLNVLSYDSMILIKEEENVTIFSESDIEVLNKKIVTNQKSKSVVKNVTIFSEQSYNNIKNIVTSEDAEKVIKRAIAYTERKGLTYKDGEKCHFTTTFAGLCNQFGVELNEVLSVADSLKFSNDTKNRIKALYTNYKAQFGTKSIKNVAYKNIVTNIVGNIEIGQKLSDLGLKKDEIVNKLLVSPTGSGKTYFISKLQGKKVVVVPSQKLSEELANAYNGKVFNQYFKEVSSLDDLIFVTYASYPNLIRKIDISRFDVYLDEAHNFTSSATRTFMLDELSAVVDALKVNNQKSTTLLTATPIRFSDPYLASFEEVRVTSNDTKVKEVTIERTADVNKLLKDKFEEGKKDNKFVAVLLNNTKDTLNGYVNAVKDYSVQIFNATKKTENYFVELISTGKIEDIDGMFSTTVLKEGNSLYLNEAKEVTVVVIGKFSVDDMEQFAARFRNATKVNLVIVRDDKFESKDTYFDGFREEKEIIEAAEFNVNYFNTLLNSANTYQNNMLKGLNALQDSFTKFNERSGVYEVDYLTVSNFVYEKEKSVTNSNLDFMKDCFEGLGWSFKGIIDNNSVLSKAEEKQLKKDNKQSKKDRLNVIEVALNKIALEGLETNRDVCNSFDNTISPVEADVRHKVNFIANYSDDVTKVFEVYREVSETTQKWNKFEKQVLVAKINTNSSIVGREDKLLYTGLYGAFKVGEVLTAEDVAEKVLNVMNTKNYKSKEEITNRKAVQILGWLFDIEVKVVRVGSALVKKYEVKGLPNVINKLNINTDTLIAANNEVMEYLQSKSAGLKK